MGNRVPTPIFQRMAGVETEYAIRAAEVEPEYEVGDRIFRVIVRRIREQLPAVTADHEKTGVFLANGGAVWREVLFESDRPGLIEGSTPECRGPLQLHTYQCAQDRLLAQAVDYCGKFGAIQLLKNDHDSQGNLYGTHENFEVPIATGWRLILWRLLMAAMLPIVLGTWAALALAIAAAIVFMVVLVLARMTFSSGKYQTALQAALDTTGYETVISGFVQVATFPVASYLWLSVWMLAFVPQRRHLLDFLATRNVFAGSGAIDGDQFQIANRAAHVNCRLGFNGLIEDQPVFSIGHFLKRVCFQSRNVWSDYTSLFAARQRLQICVGDSNVLPAVEFLRLGSAMLVLDAIDGGYVRQLPKLKQPLDVVRAVAKDTSLAKTFACRDGEQRTALQVQRNYWKACQQMVNEHPDPPAEAEVVLNLWDEVLTALEQFAADHAGDHTKEPWKEAGDHGVHDELVGLLDWVAKRRMLQAAGPEVAPAAREKIDLRFHELSADGYAAQLRQTGIVRDIVEESDIERAMRLPPEGTPAADRGRYIREFGSEYQKMRASWDRVLLKKNKKRFSIWLSGARRRKHPPVDVTEETELDDETNS